MARGEIKAYALRVAWVSTGVVALVAWSTAAGSAQTASVADRSVPRLAAATAVLDHYRSSRSLDDLKTARELLWSANDFSTIRPENLVARRRSVTAGYARIIHELESLEDPAFDPNDPKNRPLICVTPPQDPTGRQYRSCTDPKDIADPGTRAAYIAAIDANNAKMQRREMQLRVRRLEDEVTDNLGLVLRRYRSRAPADAAALDAILRQAAISDARRSKLDGQF